MKAKLNYSNIDDRQYINKVLFVGGLFSLGSALAISWPALVYLINKIA